MGKRAEPGAPKREKPRDWFRLDVHNEADGGSSADVYIYDVIGGWFGIEAKDFVTTIAALDVDQLNLYVNSPGGDVYDGIAITNALRRHPANVTAIVDGLAASAASMVLMGANEVEMGPNSELMIHDAWSWAMGNADDMRDAADFLDRVSGNIASMYAARAGGSADEWRQIMLDETWYSAQEAVDVGLADRVGDDVHEEASNVFDMSVFAHAGRKDAPEPPLGRIRAAALAHPRRSAKTLNKTVEQATVLLDELENLPEQDAQGTEPDGPAETEEENAVTDSAENETVQDQPVTVAAMSAAFKEALAEFAPAAQSTAIPSSLAAPVSKDLTYREAMNIFASRAQGLATPEASERVKSTLTNGQSVFASLANVGFGDADEGGIVNTNPPQWIGELIDRVPYASLWDLVAHADLTSPKVTGFQMVTKPTGGTKADKGGAVVSTGVKWSPVTEDANRWAGADSFDRMAFDFGISSSALDGYFRAQTYNYLVARDVVLLNAMLADLTATPADAAPTGSAISDVTNLLLEGVVNVISQGGGVANLGVVPVASFKSLIKNSREQAPAFISIDLGALTQGEVEGKLTVRPDLTDTIDAGNVLVGNGAVGITGYELPGVPLRAEQIQVSIGNIDVGLFGYNAAIRQSENFFSLVEGESDS